jgi:glycosyltransferase involved in cell wall biosynthesis
MNKLINKVTVIIPTKNRPLDLQKAVESVMQQKKLPDQLIIVDQSDDDESVVIVAEIMKNQQLELSYIHDTTVSGLVDAKRVGVEHSKHAIICFLEDDIVLDESYLQEVIAGFDSNKEMVACSGVITNQPSSSALYILLHDLFFRGIYFDPRIKISMAKSPETMIRCDVLSGGLSCWRAFVFDDIKFDVDNNLFIF